MFPVVLVLQPEIAKSWLEYRFQRLPAARKNAGYYGYKGAMFPWQSAATGEEDTPVWALTGAFEHHVTASVGIAAWNYYCVTQDKDWLRERGWPILSATADFWASRVEREGPGNFSIRNVVAVDEWAENVDNDAYTNGAANVNLEYATAAAAVLGLKADPDWKLVADNIPILRFPDGVTREHGTYHGERIKQADVNLLAYPLKIVTESVAVRRDLAYYENRVPHEGTPAMTQAIFALLYARLGDGAKADHFFRDSYLPNLNPPFRVIAETKGGTNPYFATGAGGALQTVLMGFGGLEITPNGITQLPSALPPNWRRLTLTGVGVQKRTYERTANAAVK
jgi:trehalose/maltose hydrolase-like predicted phosphorylase